MNKSWIIIKLGIVIILLMFSGKSFSSGTDFWTYLGRFINKSAYEYMVYESCSPATSLEQVEWTSRLRLLPYNKDKATDSIGEYDILLKDPGLFGCIIKVAPTKSDVPSNTFYIKTGVKASGKCSWDFAQGPYTVIVSPVYFDNFDDYQIDAHKENKELILNRIRYCGYQSSILSMTFDENTFELGSWHRSEVLDQGFHKVKRELVGSQFENDMDDLGFEDTQSSEVATNNKMESDDDNC